MTHNYTRTESDRFFQRVFFFGESSFVATQKQLLSIARFTNGPHGRERCVFTSPPHAGHNIEKLDAGWFYTPSVKELRDELHEELQNFKSERPKYLDLVRSKFPEFREIPIAHDVGDSAALHREKPGALFQAASQFNLLEFPSADCVPEMGIGPYAHDPTQGPACAVSCAAGTAYRCYLMPERFVTGGDGDAAGTAGDLRRGQRERFQANMLRDVTRAITDGTTTGLPSVAPDTYYTIRNGYFTSTDEQMTRLMERVRAMAAAREMRAEDFMAELSSLVRIGVVEDTVVTSPLYLRGSNPLILHKVTQTYNSALSLAQRHASGSPWAVFATMVLVGSYEATLLCGALHTLKFLRQRVATDPLPPMLPPIYLTKVGGGVFLNDASWIRYAIELSRRAMTKYNVPMNVRLVHFKNVDEEYVK